MSDDVVDTGGIPTPSAVGEKAPNVNDVSQDLDEWASREDAKSRARAPDGKFASKGVPSGTNDQKQVKDALRATVRQAVRQDPSEQAESAPEGEPERQEPAPKRKVRGVVNGREEEFDISSDEFQKLNAVQAMRAAQEAFRQASEMRKEAQLVRQALDVAKQEVSKNPMKLLETLGIDRNQVLEFAQRQVYEKLSETIDPQTGQPYTPEQQRIRELQNALRQKEEVEAQQQKQAEQAEMEQLKEVMRRDLDRTFTEALRETGLPATQYTMMRLADLMEAMGPDVDAKMLAPIVYEDMTREVAETIGAMPVEIAVQLLPKKFLDSLRKYDLDSAKKSKEKLRGTPRSIPGNREQRIPDRNQKTTSMTEAQDWLDKWAEGR